MASRAQRERYHEIRALMCERFPAVFTPRGTEPVALAIGIHTELLRRLDGRVGEVEFHCFMMGWTQRLEYQRVLAAGGARHDLDGNPVGEIGDAERDLAVTRVAAAEAKADRQARPQQPAIGGKNRKGRLQEQRAQAKKLYVDAAPGGVPTGDARRNRARKWKRLRHAEKLPWLQRAEARQHMSA